MVLYLAAAVLQAHRAFLLGGPLDFGETSEYFRDNLHRINVGSAIATSQRFFRQIAPEKLLGSGMAPSLPPDSPMLFGRGDNWLLPPLEALRARLLHRKGVLEAAVQKLVMREIALRSKRKAEVAAGGCVSIRSSRKSFPACRRCGAPRDIDLIPLDKLPRYLGGEWDGAILRGNQVPTKRVLRSQRKHQPAARAASNPGPLDTASDMQRVAEQRRPKPDSPQTLCYHCSGVFQIGNSPRAWPGGLTRQQAFVRSAIHELHSCMAMVNRLESQLLSLDDKADPRRWIRSKMINSAMILASGVLLGALGVHLIMTQGQLAQE